MKKTKFSTLYSVFFFNFRNVHVKSMLSYHIVCTTPQDGLNYVFWCGTFLRISTVNLLGIVIELKLSFLTKRAPFPYYFLCSRKPQDVTLSKKKRKRIKNSKKYTSIYLKG